MTDPTAQFEAAQERFAHVDDWLCPACDVLVPFAHPCDACGAREAGDVDGLLAAEQAVWDAWREDRLGAGLPLWEGEAQ